MMDLLLVNPWPVLANRDAGGALKPYFPLGLLYIAAYARERGWSVGVHDDSLCGIGLEEALRLHRPRVAGFYCANMTRPSTSAALRLARDSGALVLAGGPDPSLNPELYLSWGAQIIVRGEGEQACVDVLQRLGAGREIRGIGSVPGLIFKEGASVRATAERTRLRDIDSLPEPAWDLLPMERYLSESRRLLGRRVLSLTSSRGCPLDCAWCSKEVYGQSYRKRSAERVAAELASLKSTFRPDWVMITDDVFTMNPGWLARFADEVGRLDARIPFECIGRPEQLTDAAVRDLRRAGCARVTLGAESGSQGMLDRMKKGFRPDEIENACRLLRLHGIASEAYAMVGYPGETLADLDATARLVAAARPDVLNVTTAFPIRGTAFDRMLPARHAPETACPESALPYPTEFPRAYYGLARRYLVQSWLEAMAPSRPLKLYHGVLRALYRAICAACAPLRRSLKLAHVAPDYRNGRRTREEAYAERPVAA